MRFLLIIPARGGSKGIKNKNIIDMNGKPLIAYTIEPALKLLQNLLVEKVIVSTDSNQIKVVAERFKVEVPFLRPKEISGDTAKSIDFILHALNFFDQKRIYFETVITLQPTAPLRKYCDLVNAINLFINTSNCESLISCYKEEYINDLVMYRKDGIQAIPINANHNKGMRRQDQESLYIRNGAIYITSVKYLKDTMQVISDRPVMYEMPKCRSFNLDTEEDLKIIKRMI